MLTQYFSKNFRLTVLKYSKENSLFCVLSVQEKYCVPASSVSSSITKPLFALNALDNRCWVVDSTIPEKLLSFSFERKEAS